MAEDLDRLHDDPAPAARASGSGRVGWLIAMSIAVAAILATAVVLAIRTDEEPGMPGMDMGRRPTLGVGATPVLPGSRP